MHINNAIFNNTVTKLFTILKKCFLSNMNPTSYLNATSQVKKKIRTNRVNEKIYLKIH